MTRATARHAAPPRPPEPPTFTRTIGWFACTFFISSVGFLGLQSLAGHILGVAEYGLFASITTASIVLGQLGTFGLHRSGLRLIARSIAHNEPDRGVDAAYDAVRLVGLLALPALSIVWGILCIPAFAAPFPPLLTEVALVVSVAILTHSLAFTTIAAGFLRGGRRVAAASLLDGRSGGAVMVIVQAAALSALIGDHSHQRLAHCLIAMGIGAVPALVLAWVLVFRYAAPRAGARSTRGDVTEKVREGMTFAGIQAAGMLNSQVETWIAALLLSHVAASGFAAAQRISLLVVLPLYAMQTVYSPAFSRLAHDGRRAEIGRLLRAINTASLVLCLVVSAILAIFGGPVLGKIFGHGFAASSGLLTILLIGPIGIAGLGMSGIAMSMSDGESGVWRIQGGAVPVRVAAGIVCALLWGTTGLACAASAVTVASWVLVAMATRRHLRTGRLFTVNRSELRAILHV